MRKVEIWLGSLITLAWTLDATTAYPEWRSSEGYSIEWRLKEFSGYKLTTHQFYSPKHQMIRWDTFGGTNKAFLSLREQELYYYFPKTDDTDTVVTGCYHFSTLPLSQKGLKRLYFPDLSDYVNKSRISYGGTIVEKWSNGFDAKVYIKYIEGRMDEPILYKTILEDKSTVFSYFKRGTPSDSIFARPLLPCVSTEDEAVIDQITTFVLKHLYGKDYIFRISDKLLTSSRHQKFWGYRQSQVLNHGLGSALPSEYTEEQIEERLKILPPILDWRYKGFNASARDQGDCRSCWAFAAVAAIEAAFFVKTGKLERLSEQALIDCTWFNDNDGCFGGNAYSAFEWLKIHKGIPRAANYGPYLRENGRCNISAEVIPIKGYVRVTNKLNTEYENENRVKVALYDHGPLVATITVTREFESFNYTNNRVLTPTDGWNKDKNHEVVIVGYGTTSAGDTYWIIRNSWGKTWGDKGYAYVLSKSDALHIYDDAFYVKV